MDTRFMQMHNLVVTREVIINAMFPVDRMRELHIIIAPPPLHAPPPHHCATTAPLHHCTTAPLHHCTIAAPLHRSIACWYAVSSVGSCSTGLTKSITGRIFMTCVVITLSITQGICISFFISSLQVTLRLPFPRGIYNRSKACPTQDRDVFKNAAVIVWKL